METFRFVPRTRYTALQLVGKLDGGVPEPFHQEMSSLVMTPVNTVVNCAGAESIGDAWLETLEFLNRQIVESGKTVRFIYVSDAIQKRFREVGSTAQLVTKASLAEALAEMVDHEPKLSTMHFIKACVSSTLRVLYVQVKTRCQRGSIHVKAKDKDLLMGDIAGVVKVISRQGHYAVMLSFPEDTYLKLLDRMLSARHEKISEENKDAAAELMNMIFGQAKRSLNEQNAGIEPQVPSVSVGRKFEGMKFNEKTGIFYPVHEGKTVVVPFESDLGSFYVEVWFPNTGQPITLSS
jgi:CheY-specific phosphatase CheX